ncbi:MAG TPA: hypothetical protein VFE34_16485 [Dongiaceae bacterium]|jgi:hypothetical protein|nr:hypothetical protein [Dongiaceae bacterium]
MKRAPFRQVYVLMLGLLVALGMTLSVAQASNMAAAMTMSNQQMSASGMGDCSSCKDIPGSAKVMVCGDATCAAPVNATIPQLAGPLIEHPLDRPSLQAPILSGWTTSPNPHPPKQLALV